MKSRETTPNSHETGNANRSSELRRTPDGPEGRTAERTWSPESRSAVLSHDHGHFSTTLLGPGGQPLPRPIRGWFESRFGTDLSGVRVHTDARTDRTARLLDARAFTIGQDIGFRQGQYRPGSRRDLGLLAHELAHTVQNRGISDHRKTGDYRVSRSTEPIERAANTAAGAVAQGGIANTAALTQTAQAGVIARQDVASHSITFDEGTPTEATISVPTGDVEDDRIEQSPSPFEEQPLVIIDHSPGLQTIKVRSDRYVVTSELARAVVWGQLLFGTRTSAIIQGPLLDPPEEQRYYVVGTGSGHEYVNLRLPRPSAGRAQGTPSSEQSPQSESAPSPSGPGLEIQGQEVIPIAGNLTWQLQLHDSQSRPYLLRALVTPEGDTLFPQNVRFAELFIRQLGLTPKGRGTIPPETARQFVFDEIDRLIGAGETQRASELLAELSAFAFQLLSFERKVRYIGVLVDAWTYQPQERAVVELLKAAESRSELEAIVQLLREGGIFDRMFDDLDSELWNLLISIGSRFGEPGGLSGTALLDIALSLGFQLLPVGVADPLEEAEEAWYGLVRWAVSTLEGVWMLIVEFDKIVDGLHQLAMLIKMMGLAVWGDDRAQAYLSTIGEQIASSTVSGLKGARLLGVTDDVFRRIKWAIIWEAASWFVGVGEVKALITGSRSAGRSAVPLARISGSLMGFGGFENAAAIAQKTQRLARLMSRASRSSPVDTLRYLSYLPDDELVRLGRVLDSMDLRGIRRLADIGGESSDIVQSALERVRVLRALERTAGTLTDDLVAGLHRLMRHPEADTEQLTNLMNLLNRQDIDLYMLVVRNISGMAIGGGPIGRRSFTFFERIAQRPRVLGFIHNHGYETFSVLLRRSGYRYRRFTQYLDAIENILRGESAVVKRSFLDELRDESSRAWQQVRRHARQLRELTTDGVLRQVGGRYVYRRNWDGAEIWEYEIGPYHRMHGQGPNQRGTSSVFQAHHAVQGAWARARIPGYDHDNAPTILLRDSYRGSPHQIINNRQRARKAGLHNRTFSEERRNIELDLIEAEVPARFRQEMLTQVDEYFGEVYRELQRRLPATELRDIFGDWTPTGG